LSKVKILIALKVRRIVSSCLCLRGKSH